MSAFPQLLEVVLARQTALLGLFAALVACTAAPARHSPAAAPASVPEQREEGGSFRGETVSPQPLSASARGLEAACPLPDAALTRVAGRIAERELAGQPSADVAEVAFLLRQEGAPYVWPRVWTLRGERALAETPERFERFLLAVDAAGERRCGLATVERDQTRVVTGVMADVLADLEPLPTRVRTGAWLDVRARLLVPANAASVLVLGPRGGPARVTSSLDGDRVRARVPLDRPGGWLIQVLAGVAGGPRPVAEALVFADVVPPATYAAAPAPGEDVSAPGDAATRLFAMVNAARRREGLTSLARHHELDRAALAHATAMFESGRIAHDTGLGSPAARVAEFGVTALRVGENVAHAADAARAHRSLWASPAHRANLLDPSFDQVGVGAVTGRDGSLWVCVLFVRLP